MVTAGGPYYARLSDIDFEQARRNLDQQYAQAVNRKSAVGG